LPRLWSLFEDGKDKKPQLEQQLRAVESRTGNHDIQKQPDERGRNSLKTMRGKKKKATAE